MLGTAKKKDFKMMIYTRMILYDRKLSQAQQD